MAKTKNIDLYRKELDLYLSFPEVVMQKEGLTQKQYEEKVQELHSKIESSKRGKSSRTKGATYENTIAKKFLDKFGIKLTRTPMSGGFKKNSSSMMFKGDLNSMEEDKEFMLHLECKNHSTWSLPSWIRQAESDCPKGHIPVIVCHRRQKNNEGKRIQEAGDYVMLPLDDFLSIIGKESILRPKKKSLRRKSK